MKQTITIEVPEGKTYKQTTDKDGNIIIQYVDKEPVRSRSWEEFCKNHLKVKNEYFITADGNITSTSNYRRYPNNLETAEDAEGILALIQLTRLHDEWVRDWKPSKNVKYCIECYDENHINVREKNNAFNLLTFPTKKMAVEFFDCFKDLIEKAKRFI